MEHPVKNEGAAPEDKSGTAQSNFDSADLTTTDSAREVLIDFALKIEQERVRIALELAKRFGSSPLGAIGFRPAVRDLRLLGQEVGRLAFSQQREGK